MTARDPRITPARADLAARHLQGEVEAPVFADGKPMQAIAGKAYIRRRPSLDAPVETEILFGEIFTAYEVKDGFAWGQAKLDGYVGYAEISGLTDTTHASTHRVTATSTFVYAEPNLKTAVRLTLPLNAKLAPKGEGDFVELPGHGFVFAKHLAPQAATADDWVAVAERFLGTPYLWAGRTPLGADCSGLVQAALELGGLAALRDTDQQQATLGHDVAIRPGLQGLKRGDLVFWKGHVGIMRDSVRLLHANAHHMTVASEKLIDAVSRIAAKGAGPITAIKRLQ